MRDQAGGGGQRGEDAGGEIDPLGVAIFNGQGREAGRGIQFFAMAKPARDRWTRLYQNYIHSLKSQRSSSQTAVS